MGRTRKAKRKSPATDYAEPTPEQLATGAFHRELVTYRRTPVIDTLFAEHKLTQRQYDGLTRYRTIAVAADRSELRSCIDFSVRGNGEGLPHFGVGMNIELGRLERALGALCHIARAVAVDDETLSAWAVRHSGGTERNRDGVVTIEPSIDAFKIAWMDIRMSGERLAAAIGA